MSIQKLRTQLGMTQGELAEVVGISQSTIAHYERGARTPRPLYAQRILTFARTRGVDMTLEEIYQP